MRRRVLLLTLLAATATLIAVLPSTPPVLGWLWGQVQRAAHSQGFEVNAERVTGNAWTGVKLEQVSVRGPGVELSGGRLDLRYTLPALVRGRLPLSVGLHDLTAELDLGRLAVTGAGGGSARADAGLPVALELRDLSVSGVRLSVGDAPWTVPDFEVQGVSAARTERGVGFEALVVTADGAAPVRGEYVERTGGLRLDVTGADVTLARHWWDGVTGGTASGTLTVAREGVRADAVVSGGSVEFLDGAVTGIEGPVTYRDGIVEAELTGTALGGPVRATALVDVPAETWRARATGAPRLADATEWLAKGALAGESLGITGQADLVLEAHGWLEVDLTGRAEGEGTLLGDDLTDLGADFTYTTAEGLRVDALASYADGRVEVTMRPAPYGSDLLVTAHALDLLDRAVDARLSGAFRTGDSTALTLGAQDELGGELAGTLDITGGRLAGDLTVRGATLPGAPGPLHAEVEIAGPVGGSLAATAGARSGPFELPPLVLTVTPPGAEGGAWRAEARDGSLSASYGPAGLRAQLSEPPLLLAGEPLALSGEALLPPEDGRPRLELSAATRGLTAGASQDGDRLALTVEAPDGTNFAGLELREPLHATGWFDPATGAGGLTGSLGAVDLAAALLPSPDGEDGGPALLLTLDDGATARYEPGGGRWSFRGGVPLGRLAAAFGLPVTGDLEGELSYRPSDGYAGELSGTVTAAGVPAGITLTGAGDTLAVTATPAPLGQEWLVEGSLLPRLELRASGPVGTLQLVDGAVTGAGEVAAVLGPATLPGALPWELRADLGDATAELQLGGSHARAEWGGPARRQAENDPARDQRESGAASDQAGSVPISAEQGNGDARAGRESGDARAGREIGGAGGGRESGDLRGDARGGLRVDAIFDQEAVVAGVPTRLTGTLTLTPDMPTGEADATLALPGGALRLTGPLSALRVAGQAEAGALSAALLGSDLLVGTARLDATLDLVTGPSLEGRVALETPDAVLAGPVAASAEAFTATLEGPGLALSFDRTGLSVTAADAPLTPYLDLPVTVVAGGELRHDTAGWQGELALTGALQGGGSAGDSEALGAERSPADRAASSQPGGARPAQAGSPGSDQAGSSRADQADDSRAGMTGSSSTDPLGVAEHGPPGGSRMRAVLRGNGERLELSADAATPWLAATARGRIAPEPDLALAASTPGGEARLAGNLTAGPGGANLRADLEVGPLDYGPVGLPQLPLTVSFTPEAGLAVTGPGVALALSGGQLGGEFELPFSLAGAPHALTGRIAGQPASPHATVALAGPLASGGGAWEDGTLTAELGLDANPFLPDGAPPLERVEASLRAAADGTWSAAATTGTTPGAFPVALTATAELTGHYLEHGGTLVLSAPNAETGAAVPVLPLALAGTGAELSATADLAQADLAPVAALLPFPVELAAAGEAGATLSGAGARYTLAAQLTGTASGQPVALAVRASTSEPVALTGTAAGAELSGRQEPGGSWAFTVAALPDEAAGLLSGTDLELTGTVRPGPVTHLAARGQAAGEPLALTLDYATDPEAAPPAGVDAPGGELTASWGPARLHATATPRSDGLGVLMRLASAEGGPLPPGSAEIELSLTDAGAVVERLAATADLGGQEYALTAAGPLQPRPALTGHLTLPAGFGLPALGLELRGTLDAPLLSLTHGGLELAAGTAPQPHVALRGAGDLPGGLRLTADLTWDGSAGFGGTGILSAGAADPTASGSPDPSAPRRAEPGSSWPGDPTASRPSGPGLVAELRGEGDLVVDALATLPLAGLAPLELGAGLRVGSDLANPSARGPVRLGGPLAGRGEFAFDDGRAELTVSGEDLDVRGRYGADGWSATLEVRDQPLPAVAAALAGVDAPEGAPAGGEGTIYLRASAAGEPGGPPTAAVERLTLALGSTRVTARATLADELTAEADLVVELADLDALTGIIGPAGGTGGGGGQTGGAGSVGGLAGGVSGRLEYRAARPEALSGGWPGEQDGGWLALLAGGELRGGLRLAAVGPAASGPHLSGRAELSGSAGSPQLHLDLIGGGTAAGRLTADIRPAAGYLEAKSDLSIGPLATDLRVALGPDGGAAEGRVALPGGEFALTGSPTGELRLSGSGTFAGWEVRADLTGGAAALEADLAPLTGPVGGYLSLAVGGRQTAGEGDWLSGSVAGLELAGARLEPIRIASAAPGAPITLRGPDLEATVEPAGLDWRVDRLELALAGLAVTARGSGSGATGTLEATITSGAPDAASAEPGPPGVATLTARLGPEGWSGTLASDGLAWAGATLDARGTLSGPPARPNLQLDTRAQLAGLAARGNATLSPAGVTAAQTVESELLGEPVTVAGTFWPDLDVSVTTPTGGTLTLGAPAGAPLRAAGEATIPVGPAAVRLGAAEGGAEAILDVTAPQLPGLALSGRVELGDLAATTDRLLAGVRLTGAGATSGTVLLEPGAARVTLEGFGYAAGGTGLTLSGAITAGGDSELRGSLYLPEVGPFEGTGPLPLRVALAGSRLEVTAEGGPGTLVGAFDTSNLAGRLTADLDLGGGRAAADLTLEPGVGPRGTLAFDAVPLLELGAEVPVNLSADLEVGPDAVRGSAQLRAGQRSLSASGEWGLAGLLPPQLAPQATGARRLSGRVAAFRLTDLPPVAARAPHLEGSVSGIVQLDAGQLVGRLQVDGLAVAGTALAASAEFNGTPSNVEVRAVLGDSSARLTVTPGGLEGVMSFERFPLHALAEAAAGPLDVSAEVTGVARVKLPGWTLPDGELRVATELIRLERAGVVTTGNVGLEYAGGELRVTEAEFRGDGVWRAGGVLKREALDFQMSAEDADFSPLLGLLPSLVGLDVGARGSFEASASGTLTDPRVTVTTEGLDLTVAGGDYRLGGAVLDLAGQALSVEAQLTGVDPVQGRLRLAGTGSLSLSPPALSGGITFQGSASVPNLGEVEALQGTLRTEPGEPMTLAAEGVIGQRFTVTGTLAPFDLRVQGQGLALRAPQLFVATSETDVDLRVTYPGELTVAGQLLAQAARVAMPERDAAEGPGEAPDTPAPPERSGPPARVRFDDIRILAPGRVRFSENFGNAELALDLTLGGTLAEPTLAGRAEALRGAFQFSGRDFEIERAVATFEPTRGIFPQLDVAAVAAFDKTRVLPPGSGVEFVAPRDRNRFTVQLAVTGEVESGPDGRGFDLDLQPTLSSEALIQEEERGQLTAGPRSLTEAELYTLITLGRLEVQNVLTGQAGLATAVAEGALGTAVDLLIVSELSQALSDALGVDVVEIRSSALSSILTGRGGDPFSVSLRLGGYLSEEVFASYRIGAFDDPRGLYALTNEVNLTYELGPLELDLAGRVNFEDTRALNPDAELSVGLRYAFSGLTSLETGVDLSDDRQQVRFGVTLRW